MTKSKKLTIGAIAVAAVALLFGILFPAASNASVEAKGVKWKAAASASSTDSYDLRSGEAKLGQSAPRPMNPTLLAETLYKQISVPGRDLALGITWRASAGCGGTCYNADAAQARDYRAGGGFQNATFRFGNNGNANCSNLGVVGNGAQDIISVDFPTVCVQSGAQKPYVNFYTQRNYGAAGTAFDNYTYYLCGKLVNANNGQILAAGSGC